MATLGKMILRSIIGIFAVVVIGAVSAALLMWSAPDERIENWRTTTGLEEHHLAWLLWVIIAAITTILAATLGGLNLGRYASFIAQGILGGCVAGTILTLGSAWFNDEWPFRSKAPQTSIDIGRTYLIPTFAIIGGFLGRYVVVQFGHCHGRPQNKRLHPSGDQVD